MQIHSADFVAGAAAARGVAIVIDVFRACSLQAHALARGAHCVVPVEDIEEARALKQAHPEWLLAGERHARRLPGFDCGNSPTEILATELRDRTVIHTTHAGTQGLMAASHVASHVFTGAFVNGSATVTAVKALAPEEVTVIAMGHEARERCAEDDLCREWLIAALADQACNLGDLPARLRSAPAAAKFFDLAADWAPLQDFDWCTAVDTVPFAVYLTPSALGRPVLRRYP
ncbi:MAG: 2-phosphosulfolactate phosphatase [Gammaproteobacteria bacterium]|jgi:2-phosphosulfolactate phosphatase